MVGTELGHFYTDPIFHLKFELSGEVQAGAKYRVGLEISTESCG